MSFKALRLLVFSLVGMVISTQTITTTGCGQTKGCLRYPEGCELSTCSYLITYKRQENNFLFELLGKDADWVAVGFHHEIGMIGAHAVICYKNNTDVLIGSKHLTNYSLQGIMEESALQLQDGLVEHGDITCSFLYPLNVDNSNNLRNLETNYYVIYAKGMKSGPIFSYHGSGRLNRGHTDQKINISEIPKEKMEKPDECGKNIGCLRHPSGCEFSQCSYLATYKGIGHRVQFELRGRQAEWVSIGFNDDQGMVGTDAILCLKSGNSIVTRRTVFTARSLGTLTKESELTYINGSMEEDTIRCKFERPLKSSTMVNLEGVTYYLIYAKGSLSGDNPTRHGGGASNRGFSAERVDIKKFTESESSAPSDSKKRVHGSMMVVVWIFVASVGLFFARYTRETWENTKIFGKKVWFQFHRAFMISVVLGTIISFVVIFVDLDGFTENEGKFKAHAILGVIVFVLAILQAIGALFRPAPGASKRPIFNVLHRTFGVSTFAISVAAVIMGLDIFDKEVGFYLVIGYVGFLIVLIIIMEIAKRGYQKEKKEITTETVPGGMGIEEPIVVVNDTFFAFSKLFFGLLLVVSLAITVAVVYLINKDI